MNMLYVAIFGAAFLVLWDIGHLHNKVMDRLEDLEKRLDSIEKSVSRVETALEMRDLEHS